MRSKISKFVEQLFLDLTSADDTVRYKGLHLKLLKPMRCNYIYNFIIELLYNKSFVLYTVDGQLSKTT